MPLKLENLDPETRRYMLEEFEMDVANGRLYPSKKLTDKGKESYEALLREAIQEHDSDWLAKQLASTGCIKPRIFKERKPRQGIITAPTSPQQTLADSEFNRFYIRGVCARAIKEQIPHVIVYRARDSAFPDPKSSSKIGRHVNPADLLKDLRENIDVTPKMGIPSSPNSGISVKLP